MGISADGETVDSADIFIGAYGWRYGYIPDGYDKSIVEMEYDWAGERGLPRLLCLCVTSNDMKERIPRRAGESHRNPWAVGRLP